MTERRFVVMPVPQGGDFELPSGSMAWIDGEVVTNWKTRHTYVMKVARVGVPAHTRELHVHDLVMTESEIRACPYGASVKFPVWT